MPKCCKYHATWQVLVPNCCKYKANGTGKENQKKIQILRQKTRWKPQTRNSRAWTTGENLCNRKTNLFFFHASCADIVSAKAPDQQFTKRQLTHKDTHGKHRLKTAHISPVTSLQRGVESVECGVWSVKCGVGSVECVKCGVWSVECKV